MYKSAAKATRKGAAKKGGGSTELEAVRSAILQQMNLTLAVPNTRIQKITLSVVLTRSPNAKSTQRAEMTKASGLAITILTAPLTELLFPGPLISTEPTAASF